MKYLCINAENPEPEWFYGRWPKEMESYDGEMTENGVHLYDIPGRPSVKHGGLFCFLPSRFVVDPLIDVSFEVADCLPNAPDQAAGEAGSTASHCWAESGKPK